MARADEMALLRVARDGNQGAFSELAGPYRAERPGALYRMLGSLHDAEGALPRAWKSLPGFEDRRARAASGQPADGHMQFGAVSLASGRELG